MGRKDVSDIFFRGSGGGWMSAQWMGAVRWIRGWISMNTHHHLLELAHVHAGEVIAEAGVVLGVLSGWIGWRMKR